MKECKLDSSKTLLRFCRRLAAVGPRSRPGEVASGVVVLVIGQWLLPQRGAAPREASKKRHKKPLRGLKGAVKACLSQQEQMRQEPHGVVANG